MFAVDARKHKFFVYVFSALVSKSTNQLAYITAHIYMPLQPYRMICEHSGLSYASVCACAHACMYSCTRACVNVCGICVCAYLKFGIFAEFV